MKAELLEIVRARYSDEFFTWHIMPVLMNAQALANKLEVSSESTEVIQVAALLHDIARFKTPKQLGLDEGHHIFGAEMALGIVLGLGYGTDFAQRVEHCILTHRGKTGPLPETTEAKVIACADAMAHFDSFFYVFKLFLDTCPTVEGAIKGVEAKMQRDFLKLILPEAQEVSEEKYKATRSFIDVLKGMSDRQVAKFGLLIDGMMGCVSYPKGQGPNILQADRVLYCNECKTRLEEGYCPKCRFTPSMQDTFIMMMCPHCGVEGQKSGENHLCPKCNALLV